MQQGSRKEPETLFKKRLALDAGIQPEADVLGTGVLGGYFQDETTF